MGFLRADFHQGYWGLMREGFYCFIIIYISVSALRVFTVLAQE